jgi:transcriptional regulator with XRE-family HTH domain
MDQEITRIITQIKETSDYFQKARLLLFLRREKNLKGSEIAEQIGLKPSYLSHLLRLNRLPELVKDGYYSKLVSISHLFIISRLKDEQKILAAYEKILAENLTTQQTETLIREMLYQLKNHGQYLTKEEREEFNKTLLAANMIKTKIIQSRLKAKLIIEIKGNLERTTRELRKIMSLLNKEGS